MQHVFLNTWLKFIASIILLNHMLTPLDNQTEIVLKLFSGWAETFWLSLKL